MTEHHLHGKTVLNSVAHLKKKAYGHCQLTALPVAGFLFAGSPNGALHCSHSPCLLYAGPLNTKVQEAASLRFLWASLPEQGLRVGVGGCNHSFAVAVGFGAITDVMITSWQSQSLWTIL